MRFRQKAIKYKGIVVFEKITMPYFKRIPKLYQNNEACFMFIDEGAFSVRTPSHFLPLSKGSALLAKCFDYFFETTNKQRKSSEYVELVGILLHKEIIEEIFQFDISDFNHTVDFNAKRIEVDQLLENFKKSILILIDNPELTDDVMILTKLKEFVLLISKTQNAPSHLHFLSALFNKNATEFKSTIKNNLYSSLSIEELALLCGMSISTFKRNFKETFNENPAEYLLRLKLIRCSKLLLSSDQRISDIAYDCGFESLSTFNRSFKAHFNDSPSNYRKNQID